MMSKKAIKIICIILAGLMIFSALSVLIQIFAVDENTLMIPAAGDNAGDFIIPIVVICVAFLATAGAFTAPLIRKKRK